MSNGDKLKILCLHGYRQNGYVFRSKTGAFRSAMKKHADFVVIDAPHMLDEQVADTTGKMLPLRTWWLDDGSHTDTSIATSLNHIRQVIRDQGPFHGVLGFSQGASILALLTHQLTNEAVAEEGRFSFVILIAGFICRHQKHLTLASPSAVKSLLVIGENDQIIPKDMSEEVTGIFTEPEVLYHPGGHGIPMRAAQKKTFNNFLLQCRQETFSTS